MLEELCKRIQHRCTTLRRSRNKRNVGSCWLKNLTGFKLYVATSNNTQQGVQTDATCSIQHCCAARGLIFTQDVTDASVNTCCKLKLVFLEKSLWFSGRQYFEIRWRFFIKLKVSRLRAFLCCMSQTSRDRDKSRRVRTHEKNSGETVCRLGTIIQSIFCAQSGAGICLNFWK